MLLCNRRGAAINPGATLDRVISQASNDDCVLYKLADYLKGGRLLEEYARGGGREVERLVIEEFGVFMYNGGRGKEVTRTEYLKWKYRNVPKDQLLVHMEPKSPFDPLRKWRDHESCWRMQYRGTLGETLLHVLIMCDTKAHTRVAKILLKCFPKLAVDVVEGEEYLGASALHLAIAYHNNDLVTILVKCGANVNQRAIGSFFLPTDQQVQRPKGPGFTNYEGLAYLGELPLAWAACLGNETVYNKLIDCGSDPNLQDSFGNMILHMVVVCNQLGMFSYSLRHPRIPAQDGIMNAAGLTPLTLACRLARSTIFKEMLELTCIEFWRYSNITCSAYPLNALDTIRPNGETNWNSALMIILNGTKAEHLDMLEGGIIQRLLEEKWKTFARNQFLKRLIIMLLQLVTLSVTIYLRPCYCPATGIIVGSSEMNDRLYDDFFEVNTLSIIRYCFEAFTLIGVLWYTFIQQGEEIRNQGLKSFLKGLAGDAPKLIFLVSNLLLLCCVPCRIAYFMAPDRSPAARATEDELLAYACAGSWFMMMFFAGALKLTGPFVVMIYKMISGDMFTFSIIYGIMLLGFTQAFYFLYKRSATPDKDSKFYTYGTTWMALFHMTLGDYDYGAMSQNIYSALTKFVFLVFTIMLPIMLLNMLIAMMGNTYSTVISQSEKEWVKAWAKIVIALERAVSKTKAKEFLYRYSVPLGGGGEDGGEENLGVMVIKCKDKTKAKQRKGALSNWKRVGKVTIKELKRRGVTGEFLRREMWGLCSAEATPLHGVKKKGGAGAYDVTAGVATTLEDVLYGEDEDSDFNADANDGLGALTGAIDQLTFTNDLDFSGDGIDEDPLKPMRPEQVTANEAIRKSQQEQALHQKKKKNGIDNQTFLGDEELLLAAAVAADDEDSDDAGGIKKARNKVKCAASVANGNVVAVSMTPIMGPHGPSGMISSGVGVNNKVGIVGPPGMIPQMGNQGPYGNTQLPYGSAPMTPGVQQPYAPYPGMQTPYSGAQPLYTGAQTPYTTAPGVQASYPGAATPYGGIQAPYPGAQVPYQGSQVPYAGAQVTQPGMQVSYCGSQAGYPVSQAPQSGLVAQYGGMPNNGLPPGKPAGVVTGAGPGQIPTGPIQPPQGKLPPLSQEKRSRPISARIRRLGSAQKNKPNFDKTFKHLQPVAKYGASVVEGVVSTGSTAVTMGMPGIPNRSTLPPDKCSLPQNIKNKEKDDKGDKINRNLTRSELVKQKSSAKEFSSQNELNHLGKETSSNLKGIDKNKKSDLPQDSILQGHGTLSQQCSTDSKNGSIKSNGTEISDAEVPAEAPHETTDYHAKGTLTSSKSQCNDSRDDQWADKKSRKKNRVSPSSTKVGEVNEESTGTPEKECSKDDACVGLESGTDGTKDEVRAKEKRQRPKTCIAGKKTKTFEAENVENMDELMAAEDEEHDEHEETDEEHDDDDGEDNNVE